MPFICCMGKNMIVSLVPKKSLCYMFLNWSFWFPFTYVYFLCYNFLWFDVFLFLSTMITMETPTLMSTGSLLWSKPLVILNLVSRSAQFIFFSYDAWRNFNVLQSLLFSSIGSRNCHCYFPLIVSVLINYDFLIIWPLSSENWLTCT